MMNRDRSRVQRHPLQTRDDGVMGRVPRTVTDFHQDLVDISHVIPCDGFLLDYDVGKPDERVKCGDVPNYYGG